MGMWPGDPHGVCRNDLTPEGGVPVELLGSSKQGLQAPQFTLLLRELRGFPWALQGNKDVQWVERQAHLAQ